MIVVSPAAASDGILSVNRPGIEAGSKPPGSRSATPRAKCRRRSTSAAGSDPAQPAYAPTRISVATAAGCRWANSSASAPPNEWPSTCARSSPSAAMSPARTSAYSGSRNDSGRSPDCPHPRASQATTVNSSASASSCRCQTRLSLTAPCTSTRGGPAPTCSKATRIALTSIHCTAQDTMADRQVPSRAVPEYLASRRGDALGAPVMSECSLNAGKARVEPGNERLAVGRTSLCSLILAG